MSIGYQRLHKQMSVQIYEDKNILDALESPSEPISWKRIKLDDSDIAPSEIDDNFDCLSIESIQVPSLKIQNKYINKIENESQDTNASS